MIKTKVSIRRILAIFCVALIAGNIFGQLVFSHSPQCITQDVDGFGRLGSHFASHGNLNGSIRRGPIYSVFIGLIYKVFGENPSAVIFSHSVLLGILGMCVYFISFRIFKSTRTASITSICVILHPIIIWNVPSLWIELLLANLVTIMVWSAYKAYSHPIWGSMIIFGATAGITSLCKAVTLLFPLFLACFVLILYACHVRPFQHLNWKTNLKLLVVPTCVMLVIISPWTIRNRHVSGTWTLVSSNVGVDFLRGNVLADENSFLLQKSNTEIWKIAHGREKQILQEKGIEWRSWKEKDEIFGPMMIDYITHHPFAFAVKILKQIPAFWYRTKTTRISLVVLVMALSTVTLFILGFLSLRKTSLFVYMILILIIYYNLLHAAILALSRYSMPLYPLMLIIGVFWLTRLISMKKKNTEMSDNSLCSQ